MRLVLGLVSLIVGLLAANFSLFHWVERTSLHYLFANYARYVCAYGGFAAMIFGSMLVNDFLAARSVSKEKSAIGLLPYLREPEIIVINEKIENRKVEARAPRRKERRRLITTTTIAIFLFILFPLVASSIVWYTATVAITPMEHVVSTLDSDSAGMLKNVTAESEPDSSAMSAEDVLTIITDDNLSTSKEIFNYAESGKDYSHWYRLNKDATNYSKVEIRIYFSALEVTPYDWRIFVYQSDANNIDTGYYVDGSSSTGEWASIDVTSIIHQLDGQGFMKARLISRIGNGDEGKKISISEMDWRLTT